jgi:2-keto-4-pentenoate hydratase/2-oxohepta-3-ene-1,7-dioic acid hydratase in catechol pathway
MKWCRFHQDGRVVYGIIEGDTVVKVEGGPFGSYDRTTRTFPLQSVKLAVPVVPGTFYCVGLNYRAHIIASAKRRGIEPAFPEKPDIGYRANNALIAHDESIVKPADSTERFQYEGELVAVIGKTAKHVPKEKAMDCVFGWTIGNDVSERTWQRGDRTFWRAKNADTFKPMGPWIVTDLDPDDMMTTVRLNGEVTDNFRTNDMIFDVPTFIAEVTKYNTIHPGDVFWMGTDGEPRNMKPGDTIEIEISGIGVLRNNVVTG